MKTHQKVATTPKKEQIPTLKELNSFYFRVISKLFVNSFNKNNYTFFFFLSFFFFFFFLREREVFIFRAVSLILRTDFVIT